MALPASGPLALTDIQTEFGGANPIGMNEYYAGGGLVPSGTSGTYGAVPSSGALSVQNFYGTSNFVPIYIEDVFSTYLYTTNDSTQTITNGINLSANGGLMWFKPRNDGSNGHSWVDSARGNNAIYSNSTVGQDALRIGGGGAGSIALNTNGFSFNGSIFDNQGNINNGTTTSMVSWTFRKQPKFFDVVTYTGTGAGGNVISHNLGSIPGCIIIKATSTTSSWFTWHIGSGISTSVFGFELNSTAAAGLPSYDGSSYFTSTTFLANAVFNSSISEPNQAGVTYVAYLFASNAGGFGLTGSDNVISCGSFTADGSGNATISLGYEPQWLMVKNASSASAWWVQDVMRGLPANSSGNGTAVRANSSSAEEGLGQYNVTSTGFIAQSQAGGNKYVYVAIRRGPMKVPTVGTSVFAPVYQAGGGTVTTNFRVDMAITKDVAVAVVGDNFVWDRLRNSNNGSSQARNLKTNSRDAESAGSFSAAVMNVSNVAVTDSFYGSGYNISYLNFQRAPSFFDEVCYTGNNANSQTIYHNLGVTPEMIIVKRRSTSDDWYVYTPAMPATNQIAMYLQSTMTGLIVGTGGAALWGLTSTTFQANYTAMNLNATESYVAYMFATCPGVSKVGSYTGTGALQTINCGFTTGARFVLIRRITSAGGWYVWDSARGITAGNDPYLFLNSAAAEVTGTNYVDTDTTGFKVTAAAPQEINGAGSTFIFLAIA